MQTVMRKRVRARTRKYLIAGIAITSGIALAATVHLARLALSSPPVVPVQTITIDTQPQSNSNYLPASQTGIAVDLNAALADPYQSLMVQMNQMEERIRLARALKWANFARIEYNRAGQPQYKSPQAFLLAKHEEYNSLAQQPVMSDQLPTDAISVAQWRNAVDTLADISLALSLKDLDQPAPPIVSTFSVSSAIARLFQRGVQLNQLLPGDVSAPAAPAVVEAPVAPQQNPSVPSVQAAPAGGQG